MAKGSLFRQQGFTFLELLAAVAIMGLVGMMAVPKYQQALEQQRLMAVGHELQNDIRYLQQRAMTEGGYFDLRFYPYSRPPMYLLCQGAIIIEQKKLPEGINIASVGFTADNAPNTLRFTYTGIPSSGGTVELSNKYGHRFLVVTTPVTARVRSEEL